MSQEEIQLKEQTEKPKTHDPETQHYIDIIQGNDPGEPIDVAVEEPKFDPNKDPLDGLTEAQVVAGAAVHFDHKRDGIRGGRAYQMPHRPSQGQVDIIKSRGWTNYDRHLNTYHPEEAPVVRVEPRV